MDILKKIFTPFSTLSFSARTVLVFLLCLLILLIWQAFGGDGLIPTPVKITASVLKIVTSGSFFDNLFSSLSLTLKGMGRPYGCWPSLRLTLRLFVD